MKKTCFLLFFVLTNHLFGQQNNEQISIIQYSAKFIQKEEVNLQKFSKDYDVKVLYLDKEKDKDSFKKNNIKYLPTIVVFRDKKECYRIDGGIKLKLPENSLSLLETHLKEMLNFHSHN